MAIIGQFADTYLVAATEGHDLLVIDQHAAHERVLYEQVKEREHSGRSTQELLVPVTLSLRPAEAGLLREYLPVLAADGFRIEEFGADSFIVQAVPVVLGRMEDADVIREILDELVTGKERVSLGHRESLARIIACRAAVKAGAVLSPDQARRLIAQLGMTKNPYTCPHGRPTILRFTKTQIETMFRRIV
jgi:DNA mismatch repair protein MutL